MLTHDTTGASNTATGDSALLSNTTGFSNTASGLSTLASNTTGFSNMASGALALVSNTTGGSNTASGADALSSNTTGSGNTALGIDGGQNLTTGNNNIDIANRGVAGDDSTIKIGTEGAQTSAFLAGVFNATVTSGATVLADSSGQLGTVSSSRRFKTDIHPIGSALNRLMALQPMSFYYKARYAHGQRNPLQFGLIAEDVAKVYPNLVVDGPDGRPYTVAYQELPALLLAEIQRQQRRIDQLEAQSRRINALQAEVDSLMRHGGRH
jgi:Chaperone of endosialidase